MPIEFFMASFDLTGMKNWLKTGPPGFAHLHFHWSERSGRFLPNPDEAKINHEISRWQTNASPGRKSKLTGMEKQAHREGGGKSRPTGMEKSGRRDNQSKNDASKTAIHQQSNGKPPPPHCNQSPTKCASSILHRYRHQNRLSRASAIPPASADTLHSNDPSA